MLGVLLGDAVAFVAKLFSDCLEGGVCVLEFLAVRVGHDHQYRAGLGDLLGQRDDVRRVLGPVTLHAVQLFVLELLDQPGVLGVEVP